MIQVKKAEFETIRLDRFAFGVGVTRCDEVTQTKEHTRLPIQEFEAVLSQAQNGNPESLLDLSDWYRVGVVFVNDKDEKTFLVLFQSDETAYCLVKAASSAGNMEAAFQLGSMIERGVGIEANIPKAMEAYQAAVRGGHEMGSHNLAVLNMLHGSTEQQVDGLRELQFLALSGYPQAALTCAATYFPEMGPACVTHDFKKALYYLDFAGLEGEPKIQYNIALLLHSGGYTTPQDPLLARTLFEASANQDYAPAQHIMGILTSKEPQVSLGWFEKAATNGVVDSQVNLAVFYSEGEIVESDLARAYWWAALASRTDEQAKLLVERISSQLPPETLDSLNERLQELS